MGTGQTGAGDEERHVFLGQGTDTAGGRQELGWRAAIVEPGFGWEERGKADVEELGERFILRRRMALLPLLLLPEPTVETITIVQPS